ncbi:MAG: hypothetical protein JWM14_2670 [Chitinophagaceae bacterium]|nr:hypothetical protein [Chitinophagaceae bacterium]
MENKLHKYYKAASNLILVTLVLDPVEFFFSKYLGATKDEVVFEVLGLLFIALTAYTIRRGVSWVKYILLILTLLGIAAIILSIKAAAVSTVTVLITGAQVILMAWALVLLFKIPAPTDQDALDSDI